MRTSVPVVLPALTSGRFRLRDPAPGVGATLGSAGADFPCAGLSLPPTVVSWNPSAGCPSSPNAPATTTQGTSLIATTPPIRYLVRMASLYSKMIVFPLRPSTFSRIPLWTCALRAILPQRNTICGSNPCVSNGKEPPRGAALLVVYAERPLELYAGTKDDGVEVFGGQFLRRTGGVSCATRRECWRVINAWHDDRCAVTGHVGVKVSPVEVHFRGGRVDVLSDASTPDVHFAVRHAKHPNDPAIGGASKVATLTSEGTLAIARAPAIVSAVLNKERGIADTKPVLGNTGLDQPLIGILPAIRGLAPVPSLAGVGSQGRSNTDGIRIARDTAEIGRHVVPLGEQPRWHVEDRQTGAPGLHLGIRTQQIIRPSVNVVDSCYVWDRVVGREAVSRVFVADAGRH